jgi:predicted unusual protein kinase regulating ubiquinone biosynthesis (AarF/ABC1/UbiB family)
MSQSSQGELPCIRKISDDRRNSHKRKHWLVISNFSSRQLLKIGKTNQLEIPSPEILRSILTDWGRVYVKLGQR